jgi:hypothetical protein
MVEREIVGGREGEGGEWEWKQIKCEHCDGKGRCNCYSCVAQEIFIIITEKPILAWEKPVEKKRVMTVAEYKKMLEENPALAVDCKKCNGFGFVLINKNGEIKIPNVKKE